jgi:hypothetical protein
MSRRAWQSARLDLPGRRLARSLFLLFGSLREVPQALKLSRRNLDLIGN